MLGRKENRIYFTKESDVTSFDVDLETLVDDVLEKVKRMFHGQLIIESNIKSNVGNRDRNFSIKVRFPNWKPTVYISFMFNQIGNITWGNYVEYIKLYTVCSKDANQNNYVNYEFLSKDFDSNKENIIGNCVRQCYNCIIQASRDYPRTYPVPKNSKEVEDQPNKSPKQKSLF